LQDDTSMRSTMGTPDVRPVGDLPDELGRTAPRALQEAGIDSLEKVSRHTEKELLALHGVGPKAIRILTEALARKGLRFRESP
jgi:DNA-directed RNA polymerase alpha subunit